MITYLRHLKMIPKTAQKSLPIKKIPQMRFVNKSDKDKVDTTDAKEASTFYRCNR